MVGTLVIASLEDIKAKGWTLVICSAGFGIFIILFAASSWYPLSMLLLAVAVGLGISFDAVLGTLIQTISADHMRGRVMSFYALTFGMTPMGGFGAGAIASFLGAPIAIGIGGGVVAINALRSLGLVSKLRQAE
jgi:MFS family permease